MKILFLRDFSAIDGTYLLIVRLIKRFSALGHDVYYLHYENDDKAILAEIAEHATLLSFDQLKRDFEAGKPLPAIDVIQPVLYGERLIEALNVVKGQWFPRAAFVIGIYHPRTFIDKSIFGLTPDCKVHASILAKIPSRNLIYMHSSMQDAHREHLNIPLHSGNIINLPVDVPSTPVLRPAPNRLKLVSIGRLIKFKTYTHNVLEAIKKLRLQGFDIEYYIYGTGPDELVLKEKIEAYGLGDVVHLMGSIRPAEMKTVLWDAGAFIGVGTALVEACGWCVPGLLGIDSNPKDTTYGWLSQNPDTLGDRMPGREEYDLEDVLRSYCQLDEEAYNQLCLDCYATAKAEYSIEAIADQYLEVYTSADRSFGFHMSKLAMLSLKIRRQFYKPFIDKAFSRK